MARNRDDDLPNQHVAMLEAMQRMRSGLLAGDVAEARAARDVLQGLHAAHIAIEETELIPKLPARRVGRPRSIWPSMPSWRRCSVSGTTCWPGSPTDSTRPNSVWRRSMLLCPDSTCSNIISSTKKKTR
ncbi:hypothetical protein THIX_110008 [Thiomonas sp. X19]|uniref:hemerythrin domain-containing protein n=1 Tax=Thiomonas sp. X19 TaxID=1050370 RepID=UPI000B6E5105|nr:hemerythrin domain-containing protein [Thiomonas sp. X19]SCC91733.1 hypothetical protein THIX_110008 [Thiomonas sp. X19]